MRGSANTSAVHTARRWATAHPATLLGVHLRHQVSRAPGAAGAPAIAPIIRAGQRAR
jgi:hypothetical protein